ncbi:MAG: zinc ribbon domain-containing protein [Lachnospiraceae bacterium]|nr:zinc ribbon domain-containing protein [Lachnospiraceae bacterium]
MDTMIACPNCGAEIEKDVSRCPYCGYINIEGAEKKFASDLGEIRENIEETKKEPFRALVRGFKGGTRTLFISIGVLLLLAVIFVLELLRETKDKPKLYMTPDEQAYASAYVMIAGEQLGEAFEDKDIAEMARIFDKAYSEDRISLWGVPHYETGYASSCYMKLKQCLEKPDKKAEEITYYCFYFYYRAYGDDGAGLFDPIRENEIIPIINEKLGFTNEDMETFRDKVTESGKVNRSNVYRVTKKYFRNYKL